MTIATVRNERGLSLVLTMLVALAVAALALGGILVSSTAQLTSKYSAREASLTAVANGGLELARDSLNRGIFDSLLPLDSYTTLVDSAAVRDASGSTLPGVYRSLYVGRTGGRTGGSATAGQYGTNFASAISVINDRRGAVAARRLLLTQESWARFAVAINNWSGTAVYGCSESVQGPFHSNNALKLASGCTSPKVTFTGPVSILNSSVSNGSSGNYQAGLTTRAALVPWPTPARISLMRQYAQDADVANGDYDLTSSTLGSITPGLRIEFLTLDVNGNGTIEWDEGFMRVWMARSIADSVLAYATGRVWPRVPAGVTAANDPNTVSWTCGAVTTFSGTTRFYSAAEIYQLTTGTAAAKLTAVRNALTSASRRCYLGGDPALFNAGATGITPDSTVTNTAAYPMGWWRKKRTPPASAVSAIRADANYLIPLGSNPNFKGVIFVTGDVAISGKLRGRTSVFATGNIVLADDLLYHTTPGTKCDAEGDIFGAIATRDVVIEDNNVQLPFKVNNVVWGGFDDTPSAENYNMFFLAAGTGTGNTGNWFTPSVGGAPSGTPTYAVSGTMNASATAEACGGAPGGCIRVTGGLAQGRVDYATYNGSYGFAEAHAYDACGAVNPPPYFPTTGRFTPSRYYELDPVWLNQIGVDSLFSALRAQ